jgi:hypothetical protein
MLYLRAVESVIAIVQENFQEALPYQQSTELPSRQDLWGITIK